MCTGYEVAALAAMAGGTYMTMDAQNDAAERQQKALAESLAAQDEFAKKGEAKAMENAEEYAPEKRLERFDEAREAAGDSLVSQLESSRTSAPSTGQAAGRLSEDFLTGDAQAKADTFQASTDMARLMGKMRGASDMLTNEGYTNADYASQLGLLGSKAGGQYRADQVGINAAGQPNGTQMALGGLASGLGSSMLMSSLTKAPAAKSGGNLFNVMATGQTG